MPVHATKHLAITAEELQNSTSSLVPLQEGTARISFHSILFDESETGIDVEGREVPEIFTDLNLDQIVESMTANRDEYNPKPFFYIPLRHVGAINYRYDVLRDLENDVLSGYIQSFAEEMRQMRSHLAQAGKLYYRRQKQSWFLDAVEIYSAAVKRLTNDLLRTDLRSRGFLVFREYLASYTKSDDFQSLTAETEKLKSALREIRYSLYIYGKRITVIPYDAAPDYSADVLHTFEKFRQGAPKEYRFGLPILARYESRGSGHTRSGRRIISRSVLDARRLLLSLWRLSEQYARAV
jgi:DNA mismatch repair protein MutS